MDFLILFIVKIMLFISYLLLIVAIWKCRLQRNHEVMRMLLSLVLIFVGCCFEYKFYGGSSGYIFLIINFLLLCIWISLPLTGLIKIYTVIYLLLDSLLLVISSLESGILGIDVNSILYSNQFIYRILPVSQCLLVSFIVFLFRKMIHRIEIWHGREYLAVVAGCFVNYVIIGIITFLLSDGVKSQYREINILIFIIGLTSIQYVIIMFLLIKSYVKSVKEADITINNLEIQGNWLKENYVTLYKSSYEAGKLKHDYKHFQRTVNELIKIGDFEEIKRLMLGFEDNLDKLSVQTVYSGHSLVDSVINGILKPYIDDGIVEFEYTGKVGKIDNINESDLCIILSNLIENAKESCQQIGKGKICLKIGYSKDNMTIIISNDILVKPELNVSSKAEVGHGYGIKSVKDIIKKYGGEFYTEISDLDTFTVIVKV